MFARSDQRISLQAKVESGRIGDGYEMAPLQTKLPRKACSPSQRMPRNVARKCYAFLKCHKREFKRWGLKQIRGFRRKNAFFSLHCLDFPGAPEPSRKGRKRQKKAEGRFLVRAGKVTPICSSPIFSCLRVSHWHFLKPETEKLPVQHLDGGNSALVIGF